MQPLPLSVRDPVRFQLDSIRTHLLKRLVRTYELGLSGAIDKDAAPGYQVGIKAAIALLDRVEPAPKALVQANVHGDLVIGWQDESPSPTSLASSSGSSTTPSAPNALAPASSSVIDDLANL
jgi:hypothetical protein